jgi:hypothetical protein
MWSYRRSVSNLSRNANRHGQPSPARHPPRRTCDTSPCSLFVAVSLASRRSGSAHGGIALTPDQTNGHEEK